MAGSWGKDMFNPIKKLPHFFQNSCTVLYSQQQCHFLPASTWCLSFFNHSHSGGTHRHPTDISISICIFLMSSGAEHLFDILLAIVI